MSARLHGARPAAVAIAAVLFAACGLAAGCGSEPESVRELLQDVRSMNPEEGGAAIERFIAIFLEHCGGNFPLWLAPVQVKILTVTDDQKDYARQVYQQLCDRGWRVELDGRNEKLGYKIREAQLAKIPYAIVIGDKEVAARTVAPRRRGGANLAPLSVGDFLARLKAEVAEEMGQA